MSLEEGQLVTSAQEVGDALGRGEVSVHEPAPAKDNRPSIGEDSRANVGQPDTDEKG